MFRSWYKTRRIILACILAVVGMCTPSALGKHIKGGNSFKLCFTIFPAFVWIHHCFIYTCLFSAHRDNTPNAGMREGLARANQGTNHRAIAALGHRDGQHTRAIYYSVESRAEDDTSNYFIFQFHIMPFSPVMSENTFRKIFNHLRVLSNKVISGLPSQFHSATYTV